VKLKILAALLFLGFILLIILAADTGVLAARLGFLYDVPGGDKAGHFILYGILAFLLARAFPHSYRLGRLSMPVVILALLAFAIIEEYSQQFFATRSYDLIDLIFSLLGILCGAWLASRR
jgi:hypothetical protein